MVVCLVIRVRETQIYQECRGYKTYPWCVFVWACPLAHMKIMRLICKWVAPSRIGSLLPLRQGLHSMERVFMALFFSLCTIVHCLGGKGRSWGGTIKAQKNLCLWPGLLPAPPLSAAPQTQPYTFLQSAFHNPSTCDSMYILAFHSSPIFSSTAAHSYCPLALHTNFPLKAAQWETIVMGRVIMGRKHGAE